MIRYSSITSTEGVEEIAAAVQEDVPAGLLLQFRDRLDGVAPMTVEFRQDGLSRVLETTYFGRSFMRSANPSSLGAVGQNAAKIS
jgi:hypothetical protein